VGVRFPHLSVSKTRLEETRTRLLTDNQKSALLHPALEYKLVVSTYVKAMLELLLALDSGKVLSEKSREFLLGVMSRTRTGTGRIKGLLPEGTMALS